jgi:hypothetical protein
MYQLAIGAIINPTKRENGRIERLTRRNRKRSPNKWSASVSIKTICQGLTESRPRSRESLWTHQRRPLTTSWNFHVTSLITAIWLHVRTAEVSPGNWNNIEAFKWVIKHNWPQKMNLMKAQTRSTCKQTSFSITSRDFQLRCEKKRFSLLANNQYNLNSNVAS